MCVYANVYVCAQMRVCTVHQHVCVSVLLTHILWFFSARSRDRGAQGETVLEAAWPEPA